MKITKLVTETIEREHLVETRCDRCNSPIKDELYNAFEFTFELKEGSAYPEGGSGRTREMDLCQPCANSLITSLRQLGYTINESEWDY